MPHRTVWIGRLAVYAACLLAALWLIPAGRADDEFPAELTDLRPYESNPVFAAEGPGHWDVKIRERGWILREGATWHLWFTGYDGSREGTKKLGYATSPDGLHWGKDEVIAPPPAARGMRYIARGLWLRDGKLIALATLDNADAA